MAVTVYMLFVRVRSWLTRDRDGSSKDLSHEWQWVLQPERQRRQQRIGARL